MSGRILYQGLLRSPASWARVGRGYLKAFLRLGIDAAAVSPRGFAFDPRFRLPDGVRELSPSEARALPEAPIGLGFLYPPRLERFLGRRKVNLFVWESDRVPPAWVEALARGADRVVVPSAFAREALLRSGFPAGRLGVAPYGYDGEDLARARGEAEEAAASAPPAVAAAAGARPFSFLAVMAPHRRKGVYELLRAYGAAFTRDDDVLLRLKSTYDPGACRRVQPFEIPSWQGALVDCGFKKPAAPAVELDLRVLDDIEMLALYRQADVYVQPSWGEAFGLALLEAMANGLPAIATGWGGQLEFMAPGDDLLPYRLAEAGDSLYERAPGAQAAIPEAEALAARLRWHRDHPEASRQLGARAQENVARLTWLEAASRLLAEIGG